MTDVAAWLRGLGLERYEAVFRENDIGPDVLAALTADDLRDIGVGSVGDRRRLLGAIAALQGGEPAPAVPGAVGRSPAPESAVAPPRRAEAPPPARTAIAERRHLTVLFCDLVGSTELAARSDPEDLREVIAAYHQRAAEVIGRWAGQVAQFLGDGVLAYFGHPRVREDDAERAVRAGLELAEAVGGLAPPGRPALQARVGIATGSVVVGEIVRTGETREVGVVGETPNLAARLQALAAPGEVVAGAGTRRLVAGLFEFLELGGQELRGFAAPVPAWRVLRPSRAADRFEAREAAAGLTPLVGREAELALLFDRWERARDGEGQLVLLSGEPGIGKSRLVRALRERLGETAYNSLHHQCSPLHTDTALHPIIARFERAAGFRPGEGIAAKLAKLEALLGRGTKDVGAVAPLFADLLSLPAGAHYPPLDLAPPRRRERLFAALLDQLAGLAAERPALLVFEDAHWMDPTTAELLGLTVERARGLPVLLLVTFRPEFTPPWTHHAHATLLTVGRLGGRQVAAMAERVASGGLPAAVTAEIAAKADGVPLFVEELTRAVLAAGLLREAEGRHVLAGPLPPLAVPATLEDSLMARLDRSPSARELAPIAAAIGRDFTHELLAAVAPLSEERLREALASLVDAGLVFRRGTPPEAVYAFKHALVRDAAYGSLLRGRRRELHARIAQALEERFPAIAEREPELLAHHCAQAGLAEKSVTHRYLASRQAVARSAMAEAVAQLTAGLALLGQLPEGVARDRRELELQIALGAATYWVEGQTAPATGRVYARARQLCGQLGEAEHLVRILFGLALHHVFRAEPEVAHTAAEEMLRLALARGDDAAELSAQRVLGFASFWLGRPTLSRGHFERVLARFDPARHRVFGTDYTVDTRIAGLSLLSLTLFVLGFPDQALARGREALTEARRLQHAPSLVQALAAGGCGLYGLAYDPKTVREHAEELEALCAGRGALPFPIPFNLALGRLWRSWALSVIDGAGPEEAIARMQEALSAYRATGGGAHVPQALGLLADAHRRAGQPERGLGAVDEALAFAERSGVRSFEAELHRIRGELLLALPGGDAEPCFRRAIAAARAQEARMWELRAAVSLARLWFDRGRRREARDLLAPVYGWFTEGFAFPELVAARALLEDIGAPPPDGADRRREDAPTPRGPDRLREPAPGR